MSISTSLRVDHYLLRYKTYCLVETKYIFVTGGVVSSLGKGIIAASLSRLLIARGYKVANQKMDPYINVDPGTLNPYEHGECYVTIDGYECDLDLGHYERFTDQQTTRANNLTTGRIYQSVINKERHGDFLGKTVQIIPHVTDEIKRGIKALGNTGKFDFVITEIGGVVGDIESLPFLEAVRQLKWEMGRNAVLVHLTYVPYIAAAKELKTKPTQHSVKELQRLGLQPDVLVMRTEHDLTQSVLNKVALFCNVTTDACFQSIDCPSVFEVPLKMNEQGMAECVLNKVGIDDRPACDLSAWENFLHLINNSSEQLKIGIVGKYVELEDAYKSINEALYQSCVYHHRKLKKVFISSEKLTDANVAEELKDLAGIVVCPGFGNRGIEGKFVALKYGREHDIPTFGICLGMQCMVIEFARNVLGYKDANSTEMDPKTKHNVIDLMEDQKSVTNYGGTMRLGGYACILKPGSRAAEAYGKLDVIERHRHRFEFNSDYRNQYEQKGMRCVGENPETHLVEVVEIPEKRWYIGTQYHPEYQSTVLKPSPLFMDFVKAAIKYEAEVLNKKK